MLNTRRVTVLAARSSWALALAGCGSSSDSGNGGPQAQGQAPEGQQGQQGPTGGGAGGFGGAGGSGKVAAVSGKTAQVQGANGQVAVTWTSTTRFSQQVAAKASDLSVGDCVVALPDFQQGGSGSSLLGLCRLRGHRDLGADQHRRQGQLRHPALRRSATAGRHPGGRARRRSFGRSLRWARWWLRWRLRPGDRRLRVRLHGEVDAARLEQWQHHDGLGGHERQHRMDQAGHGQQQGRQGRHLRRDCRQERLHGRDHCGLHHDQPAGERLVQRRLRGAPRLGRYR